jgi:Raf kinase inhibitor-like YbhB/YbcL family protein
MQMAFYGGGQFPDEYRGDAFVAMHGSWNRKAPSGYEVVRVRFAQGKPIALEPFLTGFLSQKSGRPAMIGRPVGVAVMRDGALLVSDDTNGRIFRVTYTGKREGAPSTSAAAAPRRTDSDNGGGAALASAREETRTSATLSVTSAAFAPGASIPMPYSAYGENFSPALAWSGAPSGTKSFVLMMEDPDAKTPKPFVHWLLFNLPPQTTSLPEAMPSPLRLTQPEGAQHGLNSRGHAGYFGPRPSAGDPPHHYHFQVFALDTMLAVPPGADRDAVLAAMKGHVIARGEHVGLYQRTR